MVGMTFLCRDLLVSIFRKADPWRVGDGERSGTRWHCAPWRQPLLVRRGQGQGAPALFFLHFSHSWLLPSQTPAAAAAATVAAAAAASAAGPMGHRIRIDGSYLGF